MKNNRRQSHILLVFFLLLIDLSFTSSIYEKIYFKSPNNNVYANFPFIFEDALESTQPPTNSSLEEDSSLLVSSILTFRHGDRTTGKGACLKPFSQISCTKFQVLTPFGAKRLAILGQILFRKYDRLLDSNSLFITSAKNRCLQSLLNFLKGFRNMNLSHLSEEQLLLSVESDSFFKEHNFQLIHDCHGSDRQFLEVSGKNYGVEKKEKDAPDMSEDQDDPGEVLESFGPERAPPVIYESFEDPLKKFSREILRKHDIPKLCLKTSRKKPPISKEVVEDKSKKTKKVERPFYLRILESIVDQILYSKFNVFLKVGKSFFSENKNLSDQESSYSRLCENYAITLNRNMWKFYEGEHPDIKFCFYNQKGFGAEMKKEDIFLFQQGIFIAERGKVSNNKTCSTAARCSPMTRKAQQLSTASPISF